ncbi:MAG: hypothetical protein NVSMB14_07740 [Isosphaeraceae bacterium]
MIQKSLLLGCLCATWYMTGLIWFVQVVHYPLFDRVGETEFRKYHPAHVAKTTPVVAPAMLIELATSILLVFRRRGDSTDFRLACAGLALAAASWALTAFVSVPAHDRLALGFDPATFRLLVRTNWFRSISWSAHAIVIAVLTGRAMK